MVHPAGRIINGTFQSTLPRRERHIPRAGIRVFLRFQSTLPRRERHNAALCNGFGGLFQSTLPRRERPGSIGRYYAVCHFNPRSREGSDGFSQCHWPHQPYFNPRSREGSDRPAPFPSWACRYFNPRSREGSDVAALEGKADTQISIHAPAKGATPRRFK